MDDKMSGGGNPLAGNPMGGGGGGGEAAPSGEPTRLKLQYSLRKEVTTGFKAIPAAKFTELLDSLKSAANNDARIELLETGMTASVVAQRSTYTHKHGYTDAYRHV